MRSINNRPYLEHLDEKENLGVIEIDGPSARHARDDGVDEKLPGQGIVIAHFEFDLVLHHDRLKLKILNLATTSPHQKKEGGR